MKRYQFFLCVLSLYWILLLALTACAPGPETAVSPTLPPPAATVIQAAATDETTPQPTEIPPTPRVGAEPLPASDESTFTLAGQLGGTANAAALNGNIVYAGIGTRLVTVDLSDPAAARFLGQSDVLPGMVEAVAAQGGMAYVEAGGDLHLYDISDPATPVRISTLSSLASPDQVSKTDVILAGEFVYVMNRLPRGTSLIAIDVSDPRQPVVAHRRDLAVTAAVTASGGVLYIANEGKLQLVDAATPSNTLGESELEFRLSNTYWRYFVTVVGNLAYVGVSRQPLQVWDVSNPAQPARVPVSPVELPQSDIEMKAAGEALFLVDTSNGDCNFIVRVIDITDAATLRYTAESEQFHCISDIAADGKLLVAATEGGLQIFDHGDPGRLPAIGGFVHPAGFNFVLNVALNHDLAYIILGHGEGTQLAVLDRTQPAAPVMVGEPLGLALMQGSGVEALYVRGNRLYVIPGLGPMLTVDISEPAKPRLIGNAGEAINHWGTVPALNGTVVYTAVGGGLGVVDVSDPANPVLLSTLPWTGGICRMSISDRYLIVNSCAGGPFVFYDLSDPLQPVEAGRFEAQSRAYAVAGNTFFYDSTDTNTLIALDISDPAQPREVGRLALPSNNYEIVPAEGALYLFTRESLWALNVSDGAHPYLEWNLPLPISDVGVDGNLLYLAAGGAGLVIVEAPQSVAAGATTCTNDSEFVSDVTVPDGTHIAPNTPFLKTWRVRNRGTCTWDASYRLTFLSGDQMGGPQSAPLGDTVQPGEEIDVSVNLIAPGSAGTYRGQWQLFAPDGTPFGTKPYVLILVP